MVYVYGNNDGSTQTQGSQVNNFFSRIARRTLDQKFNFSKFANAREMMNQGKGTEFKVTQYFWSIYRDVLNDDGSYNANTSQNGYITERSLATETTSANGKEIGVGAGNETNYSFGDIAELKTFRKVTTSVSMKKYAGIVALTEDSEAYSEDAMRALTVEDVTMQMNDTYNTLMLKDILSSSNKAFGGTATAIGELGNKEGNEDDSLSSSYSLSEGLSVAVFSRLVAAKANPMSKIIAGQNRIGTKPIPQAFYIIVGHSLYTALINKGLFPDFTSVEEYPDPSNILKMDGIEEIGRLGRFRICYAETMMNEPALGALVGDGSAESTTCYSTDTGGSNGWKYDSFPAVVMSKDAISTVGLQGKAKHQIYTRFPDVIDSGNPIGERGYVAFKFRYATIITRPDHLCVIRVTCPLPQGA